MNNKDILKIMLEVVSKKEYQPGYPNAHGVASTHCAEAAVEIAEALGFDTRPVLNPKGIGWTSANEIFKNARVEILKGSIESITEHEAIAAANSGELVFVLAFSLTGGHGHVAVVAPETAPYVRGKGCPIVQAGEFCGRSNRADVFDVTNLTPPMFAKLRRKK